MTSPSLAYTTIQCFDRWTARLGTDWERFRLALMRRLRHFHFRHRFGGDHLTSLDGQLSSCFSFSSRLITFETKKHVPTKKRQTMLLLFFQTAKESKWRKAVATSTTTRKSRKAWAMHLSSMLIMNDDGWKDGAD
jgi:hypothetical protein